MMNDAKELVDAGISAYEVAKQLGVARETVKRWTDPEFAVRQRAYNRRSMRKRGVARRKALRLIERMKDLDDIGVHYSCIALVLNLDYRTDLNAERVRYALQKDIDPEEIPASIAKCVEKSMSRAVPTGPFVEWLSSCSMSLEEISIRVREYEPAAAKSRMFRARNQSKVDLEFVDSILTAAGVPDQLWVLYPDEA